MGIKHLNKFIRVNCSDSINCIPLSQLSGKKIAVDVSIYMYKYADALIENMYLMLSVFRYYNIIPIFVFDGKSPVEKKQLIRKRREDKRVAEKEFNRLNETLKDASNDEKVKQEISLQMDSLKKQFVYISKSQIQSVKQLVQSYGMTYYDAPGEADELCAMLVMKKKVWACMSEDMDMFVYGCNRVLRYFSLLNHTVVYYDTKRILDELNLSLQEFREICILSGTDYNIDHDNKKSPTLERTMKYFKKYTRDRENHAHSHSDPATFYQWLMNTKTGYINDYELLVKIYSIFDISNKSVLKKFENINILNTPIVKNTLQEILEKDGFIFPQNEMTK